MPEWIDTVPVDALPDDGGKLFSYLDKRLALFRTPTGVFATDNRCPHEGYALVRGDVKSRRADVRLAQLEVPAGETASACSAARTCAAIRCASQGGVVQVDVADPPNEIVRPQLFASLLEAMDETDVGRIARDTMRLQRIGTALPEIVRAGVQYTAPRGEYGWDHSLATLADCLRLAAMFQGPAGAMPVIQGLAVASEQEVRRPLRPQPEPLDPIAAYGSVEDGLRAYPVLVDEERVDEAEALFRGLLAAGASREQLRHMLLTAITDHFLSYGHAMIFCQKAFELLDAIGWEEADTVLSPLVPDMTWGTRYDKLPYMRRFLRAWDVAQPDLAVAAAAAERRRAERDRASASSVLEGSPDEAFHALHDALAAGVPVGRLIDETSRAASERLGRFDIDLDLDDTNEWGWLDVTHTLTYTDALRWSWSVDPSPEVLRGLFHAVWFVNWTGRLDVRGGVSHPTAHATEDAEDVFRAIVGRDPDAAVALVDGYAGDREPLEAAIGRGAAEDHSVAPIMVAHTVKTAQAAIVEGRALGDGPDARAPLAAAARFLASPKRERFVYRATLEAVAFVQGRSKGEAEDEE